MSNTWRVFVADDPDPAFEGISRERAENIAATIRWMGSDVTIEPECVRYVMPEASAFLLAAPESDETSGMDERRRKLG